NWALLLAAVPALIVVIAVIRQLAARSAPGQLRSMLADHRGALKTLADARAQCSKADRRVEKLVARVDQTKPRVLEEARACARDAQALEKIAADKALVTANHVRRVIHEEFPPSQHEELRLRYVPGDEQKGQRFSF
ncbi:MAG: hypothetical protein ACR2QR_10170, partial [Woeseiaceae bacterium]